MASRLRSIRACPGRTEDVLSLCLLSRQPPAFASVTWHVGHLQTVTRDGCGSGSGLEELRHPHPHPALELCALLQDSYGIPALLHLAAGRMTRRDTREVLAACLAAGVTNILALRGDDKTEAGSEFQHALHLVRFIKETFGSKFSIGVAGYPSGHPEAKSETEDLLHLKEKVDAGADFVLSQMVTSFEEFHTFTQKCNNLGMRVPIIPGLYLIQSLSAFEKCVEVCKIKVPLKILEDLKELRNKKHESEYGERHFENLVRTLMEHSCCPGVHIFTMNRAAAVLKLFSKTMLHSEQN